jgi:hypothetical protein
MKEEEDIGNTSLETTCVCITGSVSLLVSSWHASQLPRSKASIPSTTRRGRVRLSPEDPITTQPRAIRQAAVNEYPL